MRNAYNTLVRNLEGKRPLGRPMRRWDKMDRKEIGFEGVDWTHVAQVRVHYRALLNAVMNLLVP
jgi:chorismate-pyruvate lyase